MSTSHDVSTNETFKNLALTREPNGRYTFGRIRPVIEYPNFLDVQRESFEQFLQERVTAAQRRSNGLQQVFETNFPILDARENYILEFIEYFIEKPKYSVPECQERGLTSEQL